MAVYVDYLFVALWRWKLACHMTADTLDELHDMARQLGLKRSWFQNHPRFPHYDLTANMRRKAVLAGVKEQRRPVRAV